MELIPILSTIILIATISTFLLAIGAYVLYKARERKGEVAVAPRQAEIIAEVVAPAGMPAPRQVVQQRAAGQKVSGQQPIFAERQPVIIQQFPGQPQHFTQRPQPGESDRQQPGQYNETGYVQQRGFQAPQQYGTRSEDARKQKDSKFLKYTTEGYVPAKEDKESGAVRWR